jgi:hypothetical protein
MEFDDEITILEPVYSDKLEAACDDAYKRCKAANKDYIDLDTLIYCILKNKKPASRCTPKGVRQMRTVRILLCERSDVLHSRFHKRRAALGKIEKVKLLTKKHDCASFVY